MPQLCPRSPPPHVTADESGQRGRLTRLPRPAQDVVAALPDRLERGASAGHVTGDGEPCHAGQRAGQRGALVEQGAGAIRLEGHQLDDVRARGGFRQVLLADVEGGKVLPRQVDPAVAEVLGNVLPVLNELQSSADVIGETQPLRRGGANNVQHHLADRVGGQLAVPYEVVVGRVARDELILAVGLNEVVERLARDAALLDGPRQGLNRGQFRLATVVDLGDVRLQVVEQLEASGRYRLRARGGRQARQRFVADVVSQPGEAVQGGEVRAPLPGQHAKGDGEVLPGRLRRDRQRHLRRDRDARRGRGPRRGYLLV